MPAFTWGAISARPPTWSSCRWVSTMCFTDFQFWPAALSPSSIAGPEPLSPRSTIATSLPRTRMYADTYDIANRRQSPATGPLAAGTGTGEGAGEGEGEGAEEEQPARTVTP